MEYWLVIFFYIGHKHSRFWRNCFRTVVQTAFYVSEGETIVSSNSEQKTLYLKVSVIFHRLTDSEQNFSVLFSTNFCQGCQSCILCVQRNSLLKSMSQKRANKQNLFQELVLTTFGFLVDFFRLFCQNCILPVKQLFDGKQNLLLKHWLVLFLEIGRKLSKFWRNCFRTVVQTAFYMSEGETLVLSNFWGENFVSESFCSF